MNPAARFTTHPRVESFVVGQRWMSEAEPELGLGTVALVEGRQVEIEFPAAGERRRYAARAAPLRRVRFRVGDRVVDREQQSFAIEAVEEEDGLLRYIGGGRSALESTLSGATSPTLPRERLLSGRVDGPAVYDLRVSTLERRSELRRSRTRGLLGPRVALLPHQIAIAEEVASRQQPRVLLADEVGLGKTIEAGLVLHRLLHTGRAARVLVLVPPSLIHQWLVELLRRFNFWFRIFDEDRCASIERLDAENGTTTNPFLDEQLVLAGLDLFADERRRRQVTEAPWDLLVVDEAHRLGDGAQASSRAADDTRHLVDAHRDVRDGGEAHHHGDGAAPDRDAGEVHGRDHRAGRHSDLGEAHTRDDGSNPSGEGKRPANSDGTHAYELAASLAEKSRGVLLLTATPEQLGRGAHFARLRLLDPQRYTDRAAFEAEAHAYAAVGDFVDRVLGGAPLAPDDRASPLLAEPSGHLRTRFDAAAAGEPGARERLLEDLVDRHGPGRVVFRNTRAAIGGFPARHVHIVPLARPGAPGEEAPLDSGADPRIPWLRDLLRELGDEKVLLICRTRAQVEAIGATLARLVNVPTAVFHEELSLLQRDRNAAYFAEAGGARLLLCSEIGSEGRNFQFARHLVLFDLPDDPDVLEQRIGRLDRIGQRRDVEIHVPIPQDSSLEVRARWFHEGLDAFEQSLRGAQELYRRFGPTVADLARRRDAGEKTDGELDSLVAETRAARAEVAARLERERDRLLERSSFRPARAAKLIGQIDGVDRDDGLEDLVVRLLEQQGVDVDEVGSHTFRLEPRRLAHDVLPGLPSDGLTATFSRDRALVREDLSFLTWEHPIVTTAIEMLLGSESGNAAFALLDDAKDRTLLLEACFVVECVAPPRLAIDRFLPATPVRLCFDQTLARREIAFVPGELVRASPDALLARPEITRSLLPRMLEAAEDAAEERRSYLVGEAIQAMQDVLGRELDRLELLRATGGRVSDEEIALARAEIAELREQLATARIRLDSLLLVWKGPRAILDADPD